MGSVEDRARELLAAEYERLDMGYAAEAVRVDECLFNSEIAVIEQAALGAIAAALREQPEARGVVDDAMVERAMNADAEEYGASIPASRVRRLLTAAQQPVQQGGGEVCDCGATCRDDGQGRCRYTTPPSAPAGVDGTELQRAAERTLAFLDRSEVAGVLRGLGFVDVRAQLREALTQQPAQAAPGWKLVPVEPTAAMLEAGFDGAYPPGGNEDSTADIASAYAAMLAAAPTPPGDDAAGGGS